jgi:GH15 family glucan-1,4-alpha-glucosidase
MATNETQGAIEEYALIGDCETAALVRRNGSIDWLCFPRFDSGACFAALLGGPENGRWQLTPTGPARITRQYRKGTLILETKFRAKHGTVTLTDFMPLRTSHPRIFRILRCERGIVPIHMDLVIRFDYGLTVPWVTRTRDGSLLAVAGSNRLILRSSVPTKGEGLRTVSDFTMKAGQTVYFELQYGNSFQRVADGANPKQSLRKTENWWRDWISRCNYKGRWSDAVQRSLITLKAMTYAPTGGIVAAPTTSLPEVPRGECNWDYRYCWLRDATFSLLGFLHTGFHDEAREWKDWLVRAAAGSAQQVQVLYGATGERLLREWEVPWLRGYANSSPVRVGNAASEQIQLDLYGELADVLHQAHTAPNGAHTDLDLLFALLDHLAESWRQPDHGIWEIRGRARQFTHSKVMCWVAFDRAVRMVEKLGVKAPLAKWKAIRQAIHRDVCRRGFDRRLHSFVQYYGSKDIDASLLLLPLVGFLPPLDSRIVGTVRRVEKTLMRDGYVLRYRKTSAQYRHRAEGAFLPCTFWLADYCELAGRRAAAKRLVQRVLRIRNDVGLLSEEFHLKTRRLIGNFPQALTHVALVNAIVNLHSPHGPARQRSNWARGKSKPML